MELVSVKIQNYKCIDDSGDFLVANLTCLAGKNESGKTALLQALRRLNPVEDAEKNYNKLMEYPRRRFREAEAKNPLLRQVVTTTWKLSDTHSSEEYVARVEAISNSLSDEIFTYWTQNKNLEVEFKREIAGSDDPSELGEEFFSLRVRNKRHRVTVRFDERSTGFVWFFSFLVWFSQMEREYGDKLIILLDEPGLSLHGKAQRDLLVFIKEKLLPKYQVIYTTHSPFMIDTDNILNVRTVEDIVSPKGELKGTKVSSRILSADTDTLFPLRAALGYDITQSLFVGEHSLLVEGASDLLYLQWFSRQLSTRNRTELDSRWTITPVGGISKLGSFNALFAANNLHIAILTDYRSGDKRKVRDLKESELLQANHIFCAADFVDSDEADIEDMIGREFYIGLINSCYKLEGDKRLTSVYSNDIATHLLEEVEQHFRIIATEGSSFNHLSPAVYLIENESSFCQGTGIDYALDRFEKLFQKLNDLLPQN